MKLECLLTLGVSTPGEFIDLGGAVTNTTVYLKVDYYSWGSSSSWAGYLLTVQLTPSVRSTLL